MSENIAGYIDRSYIKGQTYRYAATPAPIVFTGNIDEISDNDLLSKAMLVSRGQISGGTLPNEFGNTFLITTVKYGNNTYLQTAYLVQSGYECWEYRRIYSSGWTEWIGVDSAIKNVDGKIQEVKDTADSANAAITGTNGINSQIDTINTSINTINNTTIPGMSTRIDGIGNRTSALEIDAAITDISNAYTFTKSGSGNWDKSSIIVYKSGNIVDMQFVFKGNGKKVSGGGNGLSGTISGGPLPINVAHLIGYDTTGGLNSVVVGRLHPSGSFILKLIGDDRSWSGYVTVQGSFIAVSSSQAYAFAESNSFVEEYTSVPYNN